MFEVLFNESAKGSMKFAQKNNRKDTIEGSSQDVACIGFNLDVGNIQGKVDGVQRKKILDNIFNCNFFDEKEIEEFFNDQSKDIEKTILAAKQGLPIRIWRSNLPYAYCAFAFICDILRHIDCKISYVSLPKYIIMPNNTMVSYNSWSEVHPDEFNSFLTYEKELSKIEKIEYANHWQKLKQENSPLRAMVSGKLISVPEHFYDHLILKNIPNDKFVMGSLIGNLLGKYPLGVSDGWYAFRINNMIEENIFKVVSDESISNPYKKILKKGLGKN